MHLKQLELDLSNLFGHYVMESAPYFAQQFNHRVQYGPFRGLEMDYMTLDSTNQGMAIGCVPILSGSVEQDISPWVLQAIHTDYDVIINIGAGEGYYALGFAKNCPRAEVIAYEMLDGVRHQLYKNMLLNKLTNVSIRGLCTSEELNAVLGGFKGKKILLFVDIEGAEYEIFRKVEFERTNHCDMIVELHDFVHSDITSAMYRSYCVTHTIETIAQGARNPHIKELDGIPEFLKFALMNEYRPVRMKWMRLLSR